MRNRRTLIHRRGGRGAYVLCLAGALVLAAFLPGLAQQAPDFTLKDLAGQPHKLSGYFPSHVVLLNFWATWCVPCVKELPHLQEFQDRYGSRGLQVLAISIDTSDRQASVSSFVARYGYTFSVLLDVESQVVSIYDPRLNLPYSVLLDRQGAIRYAHLGYSPGDEHLLEQKLAALLDEPEAKPKSKVSVQANESFLLRLPKEGSAGTGQANGGSEMIDQLDLATSSSGFQAGARLDLNMDLSPVHADVRLAKRYAQYSTTGFLGRAGDFYTTLGRGLIFSLVKVFEEEGLDYVVDTTVDGGEVSAAAGPFSAGLFGGWIHRPDDRSIRDKVIGGNVGWTRSGLGTFRVQGVSADLKPGSAVGNHRVDQGSFSLEMNGLGGWADLYAEFSLIRRSV
ncbi:MAG TPA: redoxin domain-containing protein, partial [Burkholderiales bacterium]|nr:redoxin domain-containing protein [Burkholderiales bacterium]